MKYRKKPIVVDAIQYNREENIMAVQDWFENANGRELVYDSSENEYYIPTFDGKVKVNKGDWIIKTVKGELYAIQNKVFLRILQDR